MIKNIEKIKKELEEKLSEKRYKHSIGTMKMAQKLAQKYGENEEEAMLTGLVHDIGKEMSLEESMDYVKQNNIILDEIEQENPALLHAKIGANIAKEKYKFTEKMQNAIKYHTTGNPEMDTLAKIIYIADKTEENRTFEGVEEIRKLANENLENAMLEMLNLDIQKNIKKGRILHTDSILIRNKILKEINNQ